MEINSIIKSEIKSFLNEDRSDYLRWKRKNVTLRGIKELGKHNNVYGSFGKGLYTVPLSNKAMAKTYGNVYFLVNAIPKKPYVVQGINGAEMLRQKLVDDFCKKNGKEYDPRYFDANTTMDKEMLEMGYDGLIIKGREMVNYNPPENVMYFENEYQVENYYDNVVDNSLNEIIKEEKVNNSIYGYHATHCHNVKKIEYTGFRIGDRQMQGKGVYAFYNLTDNSSGGAAVGYGSRHVHVNNFCIVQFKIDDSDKILILDKDIANDVKGQRGNIITQIEDIYGSYDAYWKKIEQTLKYEYRTEEYKEELKQKIQKDFDNKNSKNLMFGTANLEHLSYYGLIFDGEYGMEFLIKQPNLMKPIGYYEINRENYKLEIGEFNKFSDDLDENVNVKKNLNYSLTKDEDRITITATINNQKIGSVTTDLLFDGYYEFEDALSEDEFYEMFPDDIIVKIEYMNVEDGFKNQGIGTKLMEIMMTYMKNQGYHQYYLNASPMGFSGMNLQDLVEFYKRFGFKEFKHQGNNVLMYYNI